MRISFVLDTFGGGGKERRCLQVIQGLNKEGITGIQVIVVNNEVAYEELYETTASICIIDRKNKGLSLTQTVLAIRNSLKAFRPDIVQSWGLMSAGFVLLVKPNLRFKFISSHVADTDNPGGVDAVINKLCNLFCVKIISNSKAGLKAYHIPNAKAVLIYNGFNELRFNHKVNRIEKKRELNIYTKYVVAMVATFWHTKDWQCYIDTAKHMIKTRSDITFLAIGKGPQWNFYYDQIEEVERPYIRMMGRRDDVDEIYQICDLTVLCSNHGEGVSNSIMESMAWAVPVLATNKGGTPEIIEDGVNGRLINSQTPEIVSAMITDLLDNSQCLSQMKSNAANTIKRSFLLERMSGEYLKLYKELCNESEE